MFETDFRGDGAPPPAAVEAPEAPHAGAGLRPHALTPEARGTIVS